LTLDVEFALVNGPRIFVERIDIEATTPRWTVLSDRNLMWLKAIRSIRADRESAERIRALGFFGTARSGHP
jgi:outer membrane protein insertion porin family